jgi:hypothetical protein
LSGVLPGKSCALPRAAGSRTVALAERALREARGEGALLDTCANKKRPPARVSAFVCRIS